MKTLIWAMLIAFVMIAVFWIAWPGNLLAIHTDEIIALYAVVFQEKGSKSLKASIMLTPKTKTPST